MVVVVASANMLLRVVVVDSIHSCSSVVCRVLDRVLLLLEGHVAWGCGWSSQMVSEISCRYLLLLLTSSSGSSGSSGYREERLSIRVGAQANVAP